MAKESNLKNMLLCLFMVSMVTSAFLGGTYVLTFEQIAEAQKNEVNHAIAEVVPPFDNSPSDEEIVKEVNGKIVKIYPALKDNVPAGYAIKTSTTMGFSGIILMMVGFLPDGTIYNTAVISHAETPGLGDKIEKKKSDWSVQFNGKNPSDFKLAVKKDMGEVDAITASTISSRAFCDAVETAYQAFLSISDASTQQNIGEDNYE
jgi:electron transport complex protein RnfG